MIRSTAKFAYIVSLVGHSVQGGRSNKCLIESMNELPDVCEELKERYGLEFGERARFMDDTWVFSNITDARDVTLLVERVDIHKTAADKAREAEIAACEDECQAKYLEATNQYK